MSRPHRPRRLLAALLVVAAFLFIVRSGWAQPSGSIGVGGYAGRPSGVALKYYRHSGLAFDLLVSGSTNGFAFVAGHAAVERTIPDSPLRYFLGPGVVVEHRDRPAGADALRIGASGILGVDVYIERFEIFLQVTPRLYFFEETTVTVGGGIGLRYFFG